MWCACGVDGGGGAGDVFIRATVIVMVKMLFLSFRGDDDLQYAADNKRMRAHQY